MRFYGQVRVNNLVLTTDQCNKMVKCVEKLPSFSEVGEGAICQLTQPEEGYINGHIYKYVVENGVDKWVDVTTSDSLQKSTTTAANYKTYKANYTDAGGKKQFKLYWRSLDPQVTPDASYWPSGVSKTDKFVRSEVRAKIGGVPENVNDGFLVTGSVEADNGFTRTNNNTWYVTSLPRGVDEYTFRVFHVYASGLVLYQDF